MSDVLENGFVKISRSFLTWEWYTDSTTKVLFLHCILKANWKARNWRGIVIERGQFITSLEQLSQETRLSIKQVRTALKHLTETGELANLSTPQYRIITVVHYDRYQEPANQPANQGQTIGKQGANKGQQLKKGEEIQESKKERKKTICTEPQGDSVPPVLTLPLNGGSEYAISQAQVDQWQALYPAVDVLQQLRNMKGWLLSNPQRRKTKGGVSRFITGWLSREQDLGGRGEGGFLNGQQKRNEPLSGAGDHPDQAGEWDWLPFTQL